MSRSTPEGIIRPEVAYTLAELKRRTGWSDWATRAARRNGLKIRYLHKRGYVIGADWLDYLRREGRDSP